MTQEKYKIEGKKCVCQLAGFSFMSFVVREIYFRDIQENEELNLERESTNAYDENAIRVYYKSHHIGYVPAAVAKKLAPYIDDGKSFICRKNTTGGYKVGISIERIN